MERGGEKELNEVYLISGKARHGKDTYAQNLKENLEKSGIKACIIHYGDFVKFVATKFFDWNGEKDEYGRSLLQKVGTDICRKENETLWVDITIQIVKSLKEVYDAFIIPDTRFKNEIDQWTKQYYNFKIIKTRVIRYNSDGTIYESNLNEEQKKHPSETDLDDYKDWDMIVENYPNYDMREVL